MKAVWKRFTEHEFVQSLGRGTLPVERFKHYLIQDYLYLVNSYDNQDLDCLMHVGLLGGRSNSLEAMH